MQTGCKKDITTVTNNVIQDTCIDDCPVPTYQMAGLWTGTYTVNNNPQAAIF
jgi:hypothetical protein